MRNKKLLSLVLALAFVFSALGLAFAPSSAVAGYYLEGDAIPPDPNDPDCSTVADYTIEVTFIIEAGDAVGEYGEVEVPNTRFRKELAVEVSTDIGKAITLTTLLDKVDGTNDLTFYGKSGNSLVPFDADTDYLAAVKVSGEYPYPATWEEGAALEFDGWVVRVNDKFPVKVTGAGLDYEGTGILQTTLSDGDVVHFFYDLPVSLGGEDFAANYVRGVSEGFTGNTLTVQLQGHKTNITSSVTDTTMYVYNYVDLGEGVSASLYAADGATQIGTAVYSDANGEVTFTGLTEGTYILKTAPTYHDGEDLGFTEAFFDLTGAYSKIVVQ